MTYDGHRIFPSSSPAVLEIWSSAEFKAYKKDTYEYERNTRFERAVSQDKEDENDAPLTFSNPSNQADGHSDAESEASQGGETFKLVLRSGKYPDVTVTVRNTTKCGAIIATFLKRAGGITAPKAKLVVDGEALENDAEIEEAGLDDGDMVEVAGL